MTQHARRARHQLTGSGNLVDRALRFATLAHHGQHRKYIGLPYVVHCIEVMSLVASVHHTPHMLAAALLHDTIEDTETTYADLCKTFGLHVAGMVLLLTDVEVGNRATRKALAADRLAAAPAEVQTIKCADIISNTQSIMQHDPKFGAVYLAEMRNLVPRLTLASPALLMRAAVQIGI